MAGGARMAGGTEGVMGSGRVRIRVRKRFQNLLKWHKIADCMEFEFSLIPACCLFLRNVGSPEASPTNP